MVKRKDPYTGNPFDSIGSLLLMLLAFVVILVVSRFIFRILYYLSPLFLIGALILNYKVVLAYVKWIGRLFKQNILNGVLATVLSVLGFPLVAAFLFGKAFWTKRMEDARREGAMESETGFLDFEELESNLNEKEQLNAPKDKKQDDDDYKDLFV